MSAALRVAVLLGALVYSICAAGQAPASQPAAMLPDLGVGASLHGRRMFPADNPWNRDISRDPVDPHSAKLIASVGLDKPLHPDFGVYYGIPYVVVTGKQPRVPVSFFYRDESDPGPYPIPLDAPIEAGSDHHVLVLDRDNWMLYEMYRCSPDPRSKGWQAGGGAVFNLNSNKLRPAGWTSSDAAGLPILPGLVRYDEVVEAGKLTHAVRFTVERTRQAYVAPATHFASSSQDAKSAAHGHAGATQTHLRHQRLSATGPGHSQRPSDLRHDPGG